MIDTHVHLDHPKFAKDRKELLEMCKAVGIQKMINPAIAFQTNESMREVLDEYPEVFYAVGLHPKCVPEDNLLDEAWIEAIGRLTEEKRVVAVGETGLDFHREEYARLKERQKQWFEKLLSLAREKKMPVILHIREASVEALEILKQFPLNESGVVHCYLGNWEITKQYLDMGLYLGLGGMVTQTDNKWKETIKKIPLNRILLETDSPYVMPKGISGKRNSPLNLPVIVRTIAQIKGISEGKITECTSENAMKLFKSFLLGNTD